MAGSVKAIFKTLLKVPIIIFVTYFIFNLFAFTVSYFRLLGLSYVVLQTAVENNYIPYDSAGTDNSMEGNTLVAYAKNFESKLLKDIIIGCDSVSGDGKIECMDITNPSTGSYNKKVQYGKPITVSVSAQYVWMLPFLDTGNDEAAQKAEVNSGGGIPTSKYGLTDLDYKETEHNMVIKYTVPGLKYYPDLS